MKRVRTLAFLLATSVLALPALAQESTPLSPGNGITPAEVARMNSPGLERIVPPMRASPLVQPVTPKPSPEHKFFDRQQLLALSVHSGVRLADTIKTCRSLSHGGVEDWIPTQSCGGVAAWQAGSVGVALGVGWLFHHYGHHRLERLTPWVGTGASAAGLTKSVFNIH